MSSRVRVFFVDGGCEHADRSQEQIAIFCRGLLQLLDIFLDVARHMIERFGELADFCGATNLGTFVELAAADGAGRLDKTPYGPHNFHSEDISERKRHKRDADHEAEGLR